MSITKRKEMKMIAYIDLGLPSGTLWADTNEEGFYTFDEAVEKYGDSLPTKEQMEELTNHCQWEWIGNGYKVTGHNGNYIVLTAAGFRLFDGSVYYKNSLGYYWWFAPDNNLDFAWCLKFDHSSVGAHYIRRRNCFPVRLIKNSVTSNGMGE